MSYYKIIKIFLIILPLSSLYIFYDPFFHIKFWEYAWRILIIILFLRPIKDIFPEYKIFTKAVSLRKELWIMCWVFWITHVVWYFLAYGLPLNYILEKTLWDPREYFWWGMYWFITALILLSTSNKFAIKKLKKHWKTIQKLSYLMIGLIAIHIALIRDDYISSIITISSYILVYILAYIYKKI